MRSLFLILSLLIPALAAAQEEAPATVALPARPISETGRYEDAHIDRVWLSPTALTQPAGSISFNDYELFLLGLTVGVSDNFQLTGLVLAPIVKGQPFVGMASAKLALTTTGRVRVAASLSGVVASGDGDTQGAGIVGGVLSYCLDETCESLLSGGVFAGIFQDTDSEVPVAFTLSVVGKIARRVKLIVEIDGGAAFGELTNKFVEGGLVNYGVRFTSGNLAGDIGFVRPFFNEDFEDDNPLILGLPLLTFTYRHM